MRIALYGGSFNPPHLGHAEAAYTVYEELKPDKLLIIPANIPPHKEMEEGCPSAEERLELCRLAFAEIPGAEVSDIEVRREGRSYTADTVEQLRAEYPEDELILVMGTDMLLCFEDWYRFEYLLRECCLAVLAREDNQELELLEKMRLLQKEHGAKVILLSHTPLAMSSSEIRERLRLRLRAGLLDDKVYSCIIRNGYYDALPELSWLREKAFAYLEPGRIAHVVGCESEAVMLAKTWGEDPDTAATAGILHAIRNIDADGCVAAQRVDIDDGVVILVEIDVALGRVVTCPELIVLDLHIAGEIQPRVLVPYAHSTTVGGNVARIGTTAEAGSAGIREDRRAVDGAVAGGGDRGQGEGAAVQIDRAALTRRRAVAGQGNR